jgi:hypothetical protein
VPGPHRDESSRFVVERRAQSRAGAELPLPVTGPSGALGHYRSQLGGVPGFALSNNASVVLLRVTFAAPDATLLIARGDGRPLGAVARHAMSPASYTFTGPSGAIVGALEPTNSSDRWQFAGPEGEARGSLDRHITEPSDAGHFAGVRYEGVVVRAPDELLGLALAAPLAIDVFDTQRH